MRALLKPPIGRSAVGDETVDLIARTGGGRVKVVFHEGGRVRAVDPYRLFDPADRRRRIDAASLAALPWQGAGPDPLHPPGDRAPALFLRTEP